MASCDASQNKDSDKCDPVGDFFDNLGEELGDNFSSAQDLALSAVLGLASGSIALAAGRYLGGAALFGALSTRLAYKITNK